MHHHVLAVICIIGSFLDLLGALYLAYDLLGGEHGPLRALTRGVTYGVLFAAGYGIPLGPVFGVACGLTHGITLAWEFSLASRGLTQPGFRNDAAASLIRGAGHGVGCAWYFGLPFGLAFGAISALSQIVAYRIGIRPTMNYAPAPHFRISRIGLLTSFNRTVGYFLSALFCAWLVHLSKPILLFAIRLGVTTGVVTAASVASMPLIEWAADHVPARRMGVLGVVLLLAGFGLQSLQYWLSLLDITVR